MMIVSLCMAVVMLMTSMAMPIREIPHCTTQKTDGSTFTLPDDVRGRDTVLVVAYTQQAKKPTAAWSRALHARFAGRVRIVVVAALDRVPWFVRGIVRKSIAKEVGPPQAGKPDFVTTFEGRALRDLAPFENDDVPLIITINRDGTIVSAKRQVFSDGAVAEIERALAPETITAIRRGTG